MNLKVTLFLTLMTTFSGVHAQTSMSQINLAHQYESNKNYDAELYSLKDNNKLIIFAAFKLPDSLTTLTIGFWGAENYDVPVVRIDSLLQGEYYLGEQDGYHYYEYHLNTDFSVVALEMVTGEESSQVYDVHIDDKMLNLALFYNNDMPVMSRWLNPENGYYVKDVNKNNRDFFITWIDHNFSPAAPPMSVKKVEEKELELDSTFVVQEEVGMSFDKRGFYLFQEDTTSSQGYGWILQDQAFPEINKISELIPPLRYITSREEYETLTRENDKKSFDKFWLKLGTNQQVAKGLISRYYNRVEHANKFFTSYKEGWKTDRGMIYIVYGSPTQVLRTESGETWYYSKGNTTEVFKFLRFSHVFYPYNYVLLRNENFRRSWFAAVDKLRNYYN